MIYVVDKNTNRIIYCTTDDGVYLLDPYTYRFDAPPFEFKEPMWAYRVEATELGLIGGNRIVLAPKQTRPSSLAAKVNSAAPTSELPPCYNLKPLSEPTLTESLGVKAVT